MAHCSTRGLRLSVLDRAVVVTLEAKPEELLRRSATGPERPLLSGPIRRRGFANCWRFGSSRTPKTHARIATDGLDPAAVADQVLEVWRRDPLAVAVGERSYAVDIGAGVISERLVRIRCEALRRSIVVSDANVAPLHGGLRRLGRSGGRRPADQRRARARGAAQTRRVRRADLGGGARGRRRPRQPVSRTRRRRGHRHHRVRGGDLDARRALGRPAHDLAGDGRRLGRRQNRRRSGTRPRTRSARSGSRARCFATSTTLATEPERGYKSALAEVVKTALIGDPELFDLLEREAPAIAKRDRELVAEIVRRCIRVKARIVSFDERESGLRATLNLGHTVGHALESHGDYSRLTHGEAVSLGLVAALRIGERLGATPPALARRSIELLCALGLPTALEDQGLVAAAELIGHDKKRAGNRLRFIVAREIGQVDPVEIGLAELRAHTRALA